MRLSRKNRENYVAFSFTTKTNNREKKYNLSLFYNPNDFLCSLSFDVYMLSKRQKTRTKNKMIFVLEISLLFHLHNICK